MRPKYFIILSLALVGFNLTVSLNVSAQQISKVPIGDILREVPLIDGHNDLPHKLRLMHRGAVGSFAAGTSKFGLATDAKRMKKGMVGAQFWSVYIPTSIRGAEAIQVTLEQIDIVHLEERYRGDKAKDFPLMLCQIRGSTQKPGKFVPGRYVAHRISFRTKQR